MPDYILNIKKTTDGINWNSVYENPKFGKYGKKIYQTFSMNGKYFITIQGDTSKNWPWQIFVSSDGCKTWQEGSFSNLLKPKYGGVDPMIVDDVGYFNGNYYLFTAANGLYTEYGAYTDYERNGTIWKSSDINNWTKVFQPSTSYGLSSYTVMTEAFGKLWIEMRYNQIVSGGGGDKNIGQILSTTNLTNFDNVSWGNSDLKVIYSPDLNKFVNIQYINGQYNFGTSTDGVTWSYTPMVGLPSTTMKNEITPSTRDIFMPYWNTFSK
jgi:hypothetical protein